MRSLTNYKVLEKITIQTDFENFGKENNRFKKVKEIPEKTKENIILFDDNDIYFYLVEEMNNKKYNGIYITNNNELYKGMVVQGITLKHYNTKKVNELWIKSTNHGLEFLTHKTPEMIKKIKHFQDKKRQLPKKINKYINIPSFFTNLSNKDIILFEDKDYVYNYLKTHQDINTHKLFNKYFHLDENHVNRNLEIINIIQRFHFSRDDYEFQKYLPNTIVLTNGETGKTTYIGSDILTENVTTTSTSGVFGYSDIKQGFVQGIVGKSDKCLMFDEMSEKVNNDMNTNIFNNFNTPMDLGEFKSGKATNIEGHNSIKFCNSFHLVGNTNQNLMSVGAMSFEDIVNILPNPESVGRRFGFIFYDFNLDKPDNKKRISSNVSNELDYAIVCKFYGQIFKDIIIKYKFEDILLTSNPNPYTPIWNEWSEECRIKILNDESLDNYTKTKQFFNQFISSSFKRVLCIALMLVIDKHANDILECGDIENYQKIKKVNIKNYFSQEIMSEFKSILQLQKDNLTNIINHYNSCELINSVEKNSLNNWNKLTSREQDLLNLIITDYNKGIINCKDIIPYSRLSIKNDKIRNWKSKFLNKFKEKKKKEIRKSFAKDFGIVLFEKDKELYFRIDIQRENKLKDFMKYHSNGIVKLGNKDINHSVKVKPKTQPKETTTKTQKVTDTIDDIDNFDLC